MLKSIAYDWFGLNAWLFSILNNHQSGMLDTPLIILGRLVDYWNFPAYLMLWFAIAWCLRTGGYGHRADEVGHVAWQFAIGFVLALVLTSALKLGLDFPRPAIVFGVDAIRMLDEPEGRFSLPSGHATFVALLVTVLWSSTPWYGRIALLLIALGVGISRVWVGVHFPADVLAGYLCGAGSALFAGRILGRMGRSIPSAPASVSARTRVPD